jgi:hypothetical protein
VVNIIYAIITHHAPDWAMYFMYAFNYANGYGELIIKAWGIHWAIIMTLSGILFLSGALYSTKKYSEWIVTTVCFISFWAIISYYVGRAVPNNLTAILPLVFYIFVILLRVLAIPKFKKYRLLLYTIFLPWIVVGLIGGIGNPQFIDKAGQFKFEENIDAKSFHPDRELEKILETLYASKSARIVYYGDPYNNPVVTNKNGKYVELKTGIPIPMTLLEEPISPKRREIVVGRFVNKFNDPIFLIHKRDGELDRFEDWKFFLKKDFSVKNIYIKSKHFEVLRIEKNK